MRDVAAAAGVSVMTVSRVMNGAASVARDTAARVEQAIADLGYRRNDIARHLRQKGQISRTIGLVVDDLGNPFYSALRGRWRTPPTAGGTSCWSAAPTTTRTGNARWS